jgi:hypothetical protein
MAKDDFWCDVCGEYAPAHDSDCAVVQEARRKDAEARKRSRPESPRR